MRTCGMCIVVMWTCGMCVVLVWTCDMCVVLVWTCGMCVMVVWTCIDGGLCLYRVTLALLDHKDPRVSQDQLVRLAHL